MTRPDIPTSAPELHLAQPRSVHTSPGFWAAINRAWLAKAIGEYCHELLLHPEPLDEGASTFVLRSDRCGIEYRFCAQREPLDHWAIVAESIVCWRDGGSSEPGAIAFVRDFQSSLLRHPDRIDEYLHEVSATLASVAYRRSHERFSSAALVHADFQEIEAAMVDGHPVFAANAARLGFSRADYVAYSPDTSAHFRLVWLAALRSRAAFSCITQLSYDTLIGSELNDATRQTFAATLSARNLDPSKYIYIPVHPWQWTNRIAQLYAGDLARESLVYLGEGPDAYQAQQSIRTLFNHSRAAKNYVKTTLSILNMGFYRGISPAIVKDAAQVNEWAHAMVAHDPYLARLGFSVVREVAFVGWRHHAFERASSWRSDEYKEMLGAIWRENPTTQLQEGERIFTMAALLHVDAAGDSFLAALLADSGLSASAWLSEYLRYYLLPQLHCFFAHRLVFTPHCENILVVVKQSRVTRVLIKDIAEDIGVLNPVEPLPTEVARLGLRVPDDVMTLCIFTDIFDGIFRFIAALAAQHCALPVREFWREVATSIVAYEAEHPDLQPAFAHYDLFAPHFHRNCLNRLQVTNNRMMIDLNAADPVESLQFVGYLPNPIHEFAGLRTRSVGDRQP